MNGEDLFALDLETSPNQGDLSNGYALEPWRVRQGLAHISSISVVGECGFQGLEVARPRRDQLITILERLQGKQVYLWNGPFDLAWMIATIESDKTRPVPAVIRGVRWRDAMLLTKWVINGQKADDSGFSLSLANCVKTFLDGRPGTPEFIQMKENVTLDPSNPYWAARGTLDAIKTLEMARYMEAKLKPEQVRGFLIEQRNLPLIANSWLVGIKVNEKKLEECEDYYTNRRIELIKECGIPGISIDSINSPKQLGHIVYNTLGLPVILRTPTGSPSTAHDTIKLLAFQTNNPALNKILEAKECATILSKYVKTAKEALSRTRDGYMYGVPRIFGAGTGRFTMSNETKGEKVSIAMHQIPRKAKRVRDYMEPPEGMRLMEADANAQESRIMAIWSRDQNLINIFKNRIDIHSWMGEQIYGKPWAVISENAKKLEIPEFVEMRQNGKLVNLSSNFRIGGKSLAMKSFTEYDKYMSIEDGNWLSQVFKRAYAGVPRYWNSIIEFAKMNGYSYTIAQRRYKVHKWDGNNAWKTEGTVISHPIQGTGAEQFHASMTQCADHILITTLHDATFWAVRDDDEAREIDNKLNSTDYSAMWNEEIPIPLPFDYKTGNSFAEVK